jgi:uncharacterized membrane protein
VTVNNDASVYIDITNMICATSNVCERLFSAAKYVMKPERRSMSPILFEALICLKSNDSFRDVATVTKAIQCSTDMTASDVLNARLKRDYELFYVDQEAEVPV